MKILSLSTCPLDPMLGSGKTRLRWSEGLRALGHTVDMFEPKDYETWFGSRRALRFRQAWGAQSFVMEKLAASDYDLIEFFGGEFGLITRRLSRRQQRPLIVAHTDGLELLASERERSYNPAYSLTAKLHRWFSSQTHDRLSRAAFVHADAFVTGCELDREFVLKLDLYSPDRTAVVEPGLDREYLSMPFVSQKEERIAYVGSWIPRKGVNILSAVATNVLHRKREVLFDVYGAGQQSHAVLAHFPAELHDRIRVYPRMSPREIAEGLAKAKVFFFPTQYEGFGLTLAEAMACSCAPVTTRTGFGATLRDGEEALQCEFTDNAAMEHAILELLKNDVLRSRIAHGAWNRVRTLWWDAKVAKLEALYARWALEHAEGARNVIQKTSALTSVKSN